MNRFEFIGTLVPCKETENFKPFEVRRFPSGWNNKTLKFNVACGSNRHMVQVSALYPNDIEKSTINTFGRTYKDDNGNEIKGEKMSVAWKDRNKPEIIDKVAFFKRFTVDTENPLRRKSLKNILEGNPTDADYDKFNITTDKEAKELLIESEAKRKEFLSEYDFVDYLNKLVSSDKIKNWKFKITGTHDFQYSDKTGKWYNNYVVQKVVRVPDEEPVSSQATYNFYFDKESVDDTDFAETNKVVVKGWVKQYLGKPYSKDCFAPFGISIVGDNAKRIANKKFNFADSEAEYREMGVVCDVLNGSQKIEFTEDMLTDEQREDIELGWTTFEDIKHDMNKDIYGEKITDVRFVKAAWGYSGGAVDTAYTKADFNMSSELDDVVDIFAEDEDVDF